MPKLRLTTEERECNRFSDFIRGELKRQNKKQSDLADVLNLPAETVARRLNGKTRWTLPEIVTAVDFLNTTFTFGNVRP